ncbi:MAG: FixH family protein [Bacteroidales bacterium]|nr:FixH family protein [Bacteroidales bacterium]
MKIKWNWGTGILLAIILFMGFIIVLVTFTVRQNFDLVEKDYYPKALEYQQQIDKEQNARLLAEKVMVENTGPAIRLTFQEMFEPSGISGTVTFYRPSDKSGDIVYEISLDSAGIQQFNTATLQDGKYILKIDYRVGGKLYFQEEPVYINIF